MPRLMQQLQFFVVFVVIGSIIVACGQITIVQVRKPIPTPIVWSPATKCKVGNTTIYRDQSDIDTEMTDAPGTSISKIMPANVVTCNKVTFYYHVPSTDDGFIIDHYQNKLYTSRTSNQLTCSLSENLSNHADQYQRYSEIGQVRPQGFNIVHYFGDECFAFFKGVIVLDTYDSQMYNTKPPKFWFVPLKGTFTVVFVRPIDLGTWYITLFFQDGRRLYDSLKVVWDKGVDQNSI